MKKNKTLMEVFADDSKLNGTRCKVCKKDLDFEITGMQKVKRGYMCDDCYYDAIGDEVEKHPIGRK